jgi:RNA polymerase sigma factor (sigma-70 family)
VSAGVAARRVPLEEWMAAHGSELSAHLSKFVDRDEADDVLQQVWLAAHRNPPTGGASANVRAWLYRVATNAALDRLSRERRRQQLLAERGHRLEAEPPPPADAEAVSEEARAQVRAAIAGLPRKQREAVWFRWADGLAYHEIAARLECSPESARANVYQGMKRLRRTLSELFEEELS